MGAISVTADIFVSSLVLYFAWSDTYLQALLFSYSVLLFLNIQLFFSYLAYKKATRLEQENERWYQKTRNMTITHGAGWGIFSAAAFFTADSHGFIYIMLILLTLTISAVPVLSQLFGLFVTRTLLMLAPTAILIQVVDRFDYPVLISVFQISFPILVLIRNRNYNLRFPRQSSVPIIETRVSKRRSLR